MECFARCRANRGLTLLEAAVASLCMAVLVLSVRTFTGKTRGLSRQRLLYMGVQRELSTALELFAREPLARLKELPSAPAGPLPAAWSEIVDAPSPLDAWLARHARPATDRTVIFTGPFTPPAMRRFAHFEPDVEGHPGLHRLTVEILFQPLPEASWVVLRATRLLARDL